MTTQVEWLLGPVIAGVVGKSGRKAGKKLGRSGRRKTKRAKRKAGRSLRAATLAADRRRNNWQSKKK